MTSRAIGTLLWYALATYHHQGLGLYTEALFLYISLHVQRCFQTHEEKNVFAYAHISRIHESA